MILSLFSSVFFSCSTRDLLTSLGTWNSRHSSLLKYEARAFLDFALCPFFGFLMLALHPFLCVCVFHGCGSLCSVVFCRKLSGSQFKKTKQNKTKKQEAEQRGVNNLFLLNLPC